MKPLKFVIEVVLLVPALLVTYEVVDDDAEARAFMKPPILFFWMDGLLLCCVALAVFVNDRKLRSLT